MVFIDDKDLADAVKEANRVNDLLNDVLSELKEWYSYNLNQTV